MKRLLIFFFIAYPLCNYGEEINPKLFDYSKVDSIILSVGKNQFPSINNLSNFINTKFSNDHEKFRAIFRWVTDNIEYSYQYSKANLNDVFHAKKGVCQGYSELIKVLCDSSNIKCRVIGGLAKNDIDFADNDKYAHAWNIVTLSDKEYFVDATWAAGSFDKVNKKFIKNFNNEYFLTNPKYFILEHFPDNPDDQLLKEKVSKTYFVSTPLFKKGVWTCDLTSFTPQNAIIKTKYKFGYEFEVTALKNIKSIGIQISYNGKPFGEIHSLEFEKKQNKYSFWYPFDDYGKYEATICLNGEDAIVYKVMVE